MKNSLKSLLIVGSAIAMTATACQKADEGAVNGTQSIAVDIRTSGANSRAVMGSEVVKGSFTELENGKIFFFNNDAVVAIYALTKADIAAASGTTHQAIVIRDIPASTSVGMIANFTSSTDAVTTRAQFEALQIDIASQLTNIAETGNTTSGNNKTVQGITLFDKNNGTSTVTAAAAGQSYTHEAAITLRPAVARIEIPAQSIKVSSAANVELTSFNLTGLYVNNFPKTYSQGSTVGTPVNVPTSANWIVDYKAAVDITEAGMWDEMTANVTNNVYAGGYAYHVFPDNDGSKSVPHIVIAGKDFVYKNAAANRIDTGFWLIDKFTNANDGTEVECFLPGNVYKITGIELGASVPGDDPYSPDVTVRATVTVEAWNIKLVNVQPK